MILLWLLLIIPIICADATKNDSKSWRRRVETEKSKIRLEYTLRTIQRHQKDDYNLDEGIILFGDQKSGKSELALALTSSEQLVAVKVNKQMVIKEKSTAKLLQSVNTLFPALYQNDEEKDPVNIFDFPCLTDSYKLSDNIAASYFAKQVASKISNIKIIIVIQFSWFRDKWSKITDLLDPISKFLKGFDQLDSVLLVVSKVIENFTDKQVNEFVKKYFDNEERTNLDKSLTEIVISRWPKKAGDLKPKDIKNLGVSSILDKISEFEYSKVKESDFKYYFSKNSTSAIQRFRNASIYTLNFSLKLVFQFWSEEQESMIKLEGSKYKNIFDKLTKQLNFLSKLTKELQKAKDYPELINILKKNSKNDFKIPQAQHLILERFRGYLLFLQSLIPWKERVRKEFWKKTLTSLVKQTESYKNWYNYLQDLDKLLNSREKQARKSGKSMGNIFEKIKQNNFEKFLKTMSKFGKLPNLNSSYISSQQLFEVNSEVQNVANSNQWIAIEDDFVLGGKTINFDSKMAKSIPKEKTPITTYYIFATESVTINNLKIQGNQNFVLIAPLVKSNGDVTLIGNDAPETGNEGPPQGCLKNAGTPGKAGDQSPSFVIITGSITQFSITSKGGKGGKSQDGKEPSTQMHRGISGYGGFPGFVHVFLTDPSKKSDVKITQNSGDRGPDDGFNFCKFKKDMTGLVTVGCQDPNYSNYKAIGVLNAPKAYGEEIRSKFCTILDKPVYKDYSSLLSQHMYPYNKFLFDQLFLNNDADLLKNLKSWYKPQNMPEIFTSKSIFKTIFYYVSNHGKLVNSPPQQLQIFNYFYKSIQEIILQYTKNPSYIKGSIMLCDDGFCDLTEAPTPQQCLMAGYFVVKPIGSKNPICSLRTSSIVSFESPYDTVNYTYKLQDAQKCMSKNSWPLFNNPGGDCGSINKEKHKGNNHVKCISAHTTTFVVNKDEFYCTGYPIFYEDDAPCLYNFIDVGYGGDLEKLLPKQPFENRICPELNERFDIMRNCYANFRVWSLHQKCHSQFEQNKEESGKEYKTFLLNVYVLSSQERSFLQEDMSNDLVIDVEKYFEIVAEEIAKYEADEGIRHAIKGVQKANLKYKGELDLKIKEAYDLIKNQLQPYIADIMGSIDGKVDEILQAIKDAIKQGQAGIEKAKKARKKLLALFPVKLLLNSITGVSEVLLLAGPETAIFGAVGLGVAGLGKAALGFAGNPEQDIKNLAAGAKGANAAMKQYAEHSRDRQNNEAEKQIDNLTKELDKLSDAGLKVEKDAIAKAKEEYEEAMRQNLPSKAEIAQKQVKLLEGIQALELKSNSTSTNMQGIIKKMEHISNAIAVIEVSVDFYSSVQGDLDSINEAGDAIQELKSEVEGLKSLENEVHDSLIPLVKLFDKTIAEWSQGIVKNDSLASLTVEKFKIRNSITQMRNQMQEFSSALNVDLDIVDCTNKLDDAMATVLDLYGKAETYSEQKNLADYMAALVTPQFDIPIKEPELLKDYLILKENVGRNNVLYMYRHAFRAFRQYIFPFAKHYIEDFNLPGANDGLKNEVKQVKDKISKLQIRLAKEKAIIIKKEDDYISFERFHDSQITAPFYIWDGSTFSQQVYDLLTGKEVILNAHIWNSNEQKYAIKFRTLEFDFNPRDVDASVKKNYKNALNFYKIILTHTGNSYYRFTNKFYRLSTTELQIEFSFLKNDKGDPESFSGTYKKLEHGDMTLSPYTTWKARLIPGEKANGFKTLAPFLNITADLALGGQGTFVDASITENPEGLEVSRYYQEDKVLSKTPKKVAKEKSGKSFNFVDRGGIIFVDN